MKALNYPVALDLPFKGNRDYLHGTDIFNALIAMTGVTENISLRVHKLIHYGIDVAPLPKGEKPYGVSGVFIHGGSILGLRENTARAVTRRVPDEDVDQCRTIQAILDYAKTTSDIR